MGRGGRGAIVSAPMPSYVPGGWEFHPRSVPFHIRNERSFAILTDLGRTAVAGFEWLKAGPEHACVAHAPFAVSASPAGDIVLVLVLDDAFVHPPVRIGSVPSPRKRERFLQRGARVLGRGIAWLSVYLRELVQV